MRKFKKAIYENGYSGVLYPLIGALVIIATLLLYLQSQPFEERETTQQSGNEATVVKDFETLIYENDKISDFMDETKRINPDINFDSFEFKTSRPIIAELEYLPPEGESTSPDASSPYWVFSPFNERAISSLLGFGQPDSGLYLYNRDGKGYVERLEFCGTPCDYWGVFWLDDNRFVFVKTFEVFEDENTSYSMGISVYDMEEDKVFEYELRDFPREYNIPDFTDLKSKEAEICELFSDGGCE
jgi:hypothetical protein